MRAYGKILQEITQTEDVTSNAFMNAPRFNGHYNEYHVLTSISRTWRKDSILQVIVTTLNILLMYLHLASLCCLPITTVLLFVIIRIHVYQYVLICITLVLLKILLLILYCLLILLQLVLSYNSITTIKFCLD